MPRRNNSFKARQYPQQKRESRNSKKKNLFLETSEQSVVKVEQPDIKKKFTQHDINKIKPLTNNQLETFREWGQGQHLVLDGYAGVGKSFLAMYLALQTILDPDTDQDKIVIVRSAVQSRDIGFLPGTEEEKNSAYEKPYQQICDKLFRWKNSYNNLKEIGLIDFQNTSFLRGTTFDNAVVIFDEFQNTTEVESDTVATRMGENSRMIICGDDIQNDLGSKSSAKGFLNILRKMDEVSFIEFGLDDIVRGGFVKSYLMAKYRK